MTATALGRRFVGFALVAWVALIAVPAGAQEAGKTPTEMVAAYQSLADSILAVKKTEEHLVRSILGAAYGHAHADLQKARAALKSSDTKGAQGAIENLAADVAQLASEGDNAVGAVRKRLLDGGHHHNAEGEKKGIYDEGFVVVTRVAKQAFLDASKSIGQLARAPKAEALEAEWAKVEATWKTLQPAIK
jgi:hypothetical protein